MNEKRRQELIGKINIMGRPIGIFLIVLILFDLLNIKIEYLIFLTLFVGVIITLILLILRENKSLERYFKHKKKK